MRRRVPALLMPHWHRSPMGCRGRQTFCMRSRKDPHTRRTPPVEPGTVLVALRDLAIEHDGDYVPAHELVHRFGQLPGLGAALETLLDEGLTERGAAANGGWGDRPTEAGYAEAARVVAEK